MTSEDSTSTGVSYNFSSGSSTPSRLSTSSLTSGTDPRGGLINGPSDERSARTRATNVATNLSTLNAVEQLRANQVAEQFRDNQLRFQINASNRQFDLNEANSQRQFNIDSQRLEQYGTLALRNLQNVSEASQRASGTANRRIDATSNVELSRINQLASASAGSFQVQRDLANIARQSRFRELDIEQSRVNTENASIRNRDYNTNRVLDRLLGSSVKPSSARSLTGGNPKQTAQDRALNDVRSQGIVLTEDQRQNLATNANRFDNTLRAITVANGRGVNQRGIDLALTVTRANQLERNSTRPRNGMPTAIMDNTERRNAGNGINVESLAPVVNRPAVTAATSQATAARLASRNTAGRTPAPAAPNPTETETLSNSSSRTADINAQTAIRNQQPSFGNGPNPNNPTNPTPTPAPQAVVA